MKLLKLLAIKSILAKRIFGDQKLFQRTLSEKEELEREWKAIGEHTLVPVSYTHLRAHET